MSNQCFITRRGGGSFNKSVMFVTAPSGSTVTMQNMVRSDNLVSDVQYQEAATKDQSCVTIKQCGEVSKGDRIRVSLEVTTSEDAIGYWASESGLITDKREVNLKSGKQTITLDITAFGNLNLDTKFFCKGDESEATITAANLQFYKYTVGTTLKTATEKNGVWRFNGLDVGLWLIKAEKDSETPATQEFEIKEFGVYRVELSFFRSTIRTKYPVGSTCTCSKGYKNFTAPDTSGQYDFVVDSVGDWTVSCTDGAEKQDSEVAEITENGQTVEVSLSYEVDLYNAGDTCDSITGGWKAYVGAVKFNEDSVTVTVSQQGGNGVAGTVNKIDVTGKKSLNIIVDSATTGGGYSLYLSDSQKVSGYADIVTNAIAHLIIKEKGKHSLDIQNVSKEVYVGFGGGSSAVQSMVFSRVWLE